MTNPKLKQRARILAGLLEEGAHFDEAHWVRVAVDSPALCDSEYATLSLDHARLLADELGMPDLAAWIGTVTQKALVRKLLPLKEIPAA